MNSACGAGDDDDDDANRWWKSVTWQRMEKNGLVFGVGALHGGRSLGVGSCNIYLLYKEHDKHASERNSRSIVVGGAVIPGRVVQVVAGIDQDVHADCSSKDDDCQHQHEESGIENNLDMI